MLPASRALFVAAALVAVATFEPATAAACSCEPNSVIGYVSPPDLSVDVPANSEVVVVTEYGWTVELRAGGDVVSTVEAGLWEQVRRPEGETWHVLRPTALLAVGDYEVLVNDEVFSRFTVGSSSDEVPPSFAGLLSASGVRMPPGDTTGCWNEAMLTRLELTYDEPSVDVAYKILRLRQPGQEVFFEVPVTLRPGETPYVQGRIFENTHCSPTAPNLEAGQTYCATLTAYDGAGNSAGADNERCFVTTACGPATSSFNPPCVEPAPSESGGCGVGGRHANWSLLLLGALLFRLRRRSSQSNR